MPDRLLGTEPGAGAVGESTARPEGRPATETGAEGADTAPADPARQTGGNAAGSGTPPGPAAPDDKPIREDFPDED